MTKIFSPAAAAAAVVLLCVGAAHAANDPKAAIDALETRLGKIGAPKVEGKDKAGSKEVPGLYFGKRKINNNYDVVDEIKQTTGASATVFVKDDDEFVRVSTNVLTTDGKRGVGTTLARAKVYDAVVKGDSFCGVVDVIGTKLDSCYHPIKDDSGKVIGATYVGYKQ